MPDFADSIVPPLTPEELDAALAQLLRMIVSLPRKVPSEGYKGKVTPLRCIPLVIGVGEDGAYKLADIREALDSVPDIVWHDWLKLYGSDFDPSGARPPSAGGRVSILDILRVIGGGASDGGGIDVVSILRRLLGK
jgi:hypothetical protein